MPNLRKVQKKGGSLVVAIPSQIAAKLGIDTDTLMDVTDTPDGKIVLSKATVSHTGGGPDASKQ